MADAGHTLSKCFIYLKTYSTIPGLNGRAYNLALCCGPGRYRSIARAVRMQF
jgi:hypothetical protein